MSPLRSISDQLAIHSRTPALVVFDPRRLAVRGIGYYRREAGATAQARINALWHDKAGRPIAQWDPRQFGHFEAGLSETPNQSTIFSLSSTPLRQHHVDSGWKVMLHDAMALPRAAWDSRGTQTTSTYDEFMRLHAVVKNDHNGRSRTVQRLAYSPVNAAEAALNRCAAVSRHDDEAGTLQVQAYGLLEGPLQTTRKYLASEQSPDWPEDMTARDALLESGPGYTDSLRQDATASVVQTTDAVGNTHFSRSDLSGAPCGSRLTTAAGTELELLRSIQFNAAGNATLQTAGNGIVSRAQYAPEDGRLLRMFAAGAEGGLVQDLSYEYDPVGNILAITDAVQPVRHFANQRSEPVSRFAYDSFSQLIRASGREAASSAAQGPALPALQPLPTDPNQMLNYTQSFQYDEAGNLLELRHVNGQRNHTRRMAVARFSNRSLPERDGQLPTQSELDAGFDASGNLHQLQPGQGLIWDLYNQLQQATPVSRDTGDDDYERYVYDATGVRLRKRASASMREGVRTSEVRYLPGLEIRTDSASGEELHVITAKAGRCAIRLLHWHAGKPEQVANDQLRYGLDNHLGSCTLELDAHAQLLSREEYYPFGGTACVAGRNALEAKYKTVRYSGKERDATGLYYYGLRYYAPWLQRWINPDPCGDVDGLNLYKMVSNNPINLIDADGGQGGSPKKLGLRDSFRRGVLEAGGAMNIGLMRRGSDRLEAAQRLERDQARLLARSQMERKLSLLQSMFDLTKRATHTSDKAIASMESNSEFATALAYRAGSILVSNMVSTGVGIGVGAVLTPVVSPAVSIPAGMVAGKVASIAADKTMEALGLPGTLHLQSNALDPHSIKHGALYKKHSLPGRTAAKVRGFIPDSKKNAIGLGTELAKSGGGYLIKKASGSAPGAFALKLGVDIVKAGVEASSVINGKSAEKMQAVEDNGAKLIQELFNRTQEVVVGMAPNGHDEGGVLATGVFKDVTVGSIAHQLGESIEQIETTRSNASIYRKANPNAVWHV